MTAYINIIPSYKCLLLTNDSSITTLYKNAVNSSDVNLAVSFKTCNYVFLLDFK